MHHISYLLQFCIYSGFSQQTLKKALSMVASGNDGEPSNSNPHPKKRCLQVDDAAPSTSHRPPNDENCEDYDENEGTDHLECAPKDFSKAEEKMRTATTKGTFQIISPCGAKIAIAEMMTSESLTSLFSLLSDVMPLIVEEMTAACQKRLDETKGICTNAKTGQKGADMHVYLPAVLFRCLQYNEFKTEERLPICRLLWVIYVCNRTEFVFQCSRGNSVPAGTVPELPLEHEFPMRPSGSEGTPVGPARLVVLYDFACGAVASIDARMRDMKKKGEEVPAAVWSWASSVRWLIDKFHMKTHKGMNRHWFMCNGTA
jgi:hypothetical protein